MKGELLSHCGYFTFLNSLPLSLFPPPFISSSSLLVHGRSQYQSLFACISLFSYIAPSLLHAVPPPICYPLSQHSCLTCIPLSLHCFNVLLHPVSHNHITAYYAPHTLLSVPTYTFKYTNIHVAFNTLQVYSCSHS